MAFFLAVDDVIRDACAVGLLQNDDEIVTLHLTEMTHGFPLPTISSQEKVKYYDTFIFFKVATFLL